uniref:Uncharacterized protein n=1 Tax=Cyanophora biloba TaxID=1489483 RepID=A0A873WY69_9EUKA|nr:hypothetical protein DXZ13_mgp24 [Cyanophora biloba]QPB15022.1 hypothetical protein [Cyanophora biloba]
MKDLRTLNSSFFNKNINLISNYNTLDAKSRLLKYYTSNINFEGCLYFPKETSTAIKSIWLSNKIKKINLKKYLNKREIFNIKKVVNSDIEKKLLKSRDKLVDNILFFDFFNNNYYNMFNIIKTGGYINKPISNQYFRLNYIKK